MKNIYPQEFKIFDPGRVVEEFNHPLLQQVNKIYFQKILRFSEQAVIILNQSNMEYIYVSEHVNEITGYSRQKYMSEGAQAAIPLIHPDDLAILVTKVYPSFIKSIKGLSVSEKLRVKNTYTFRLLQPNGTYRQILQHSIPLVIENNDIIVALIINVNISAFKSDARVLYRNVLIDETGNQTILSQRVLTSIFSPTEQRILLLVSEGLTEKQVAENEGLSLQTIKSHKKNMLRKAGVKNSAELVRYGMANLLI